MTDQPTRDEIEDMIYSDRAGEALDAALSGRYQDLASKAARVILCSGAYARHKKKAAEVNKDADLIEIRKQILGN